ncbi:hypothetical protein [Micromonospora sp. DT229]|uniref:hypothetical protein n=1 Tax=Micromonospora sp. DT229 TaxID=3393430 RepID=UPI003CF0476D
MAVIDPAGWYEVRKTAACTAWPEATERHPLGSVANGVVVAEAVFGVFAELDEVPDAMALFDIATWPRGRPLPAIGTRLCGRVVGHRPGHDDHPGQLRLAPLDQGP